ncbi:hypothetical protein EMIT0232MI5_120194 [Pseudomonas sp. IT-232MI5]
MASKSKDRSLVSLDSSYIWRFIGAVALPLPEWGFAVDDLAQGRDQSLSSQEDCRWPKKPHPSPPLVAWYFPPTQVVIARNAVSR